MKRPEICRKCPLLKCQGFFKFELFMPQNINNQKYQVVFAVCNHLDTQKKEVREELNNELVKLATTILETTKTEEQTDENSDNRTQGISGQPDPQSHS